MFCVDFIKGNIASYRHDIVLFFPEDDRKCQIDMFTFSSFSYLTSFKKDPWGRTYFFYVLGGSKYTVKFHRD